MAQPPVMRVLAVCAGLVVLSFAALSGVLGNGFLNFDDDTYVTANAHVREGLTGANVAWALTSTEAANWHPVTWLSHMLDVQMFGLDAGRHHRTSLMLHAANAVLLFLVLLRMTGALWRSAFVAGLFAIHPLHVESVAWIAERKDVLSTLFWLLTTWAWLRYVEAKSAPRYAAVLVLYALGLMSKPMAVTLPFTLLLLEFWPLRRAATWRERIVEKAPLFAMAVASSVITVMAQHRGGAFDTLSTVAPATRLVNAVVAYATYLGRALRPSALSIFYPYPVHVGTVIAIGSATTLVGLTALAVRLAKRAPYFTFGWLWYVGTLVPVIGLIQVGAQATADRYTYVPLIGLFVALSWALSELASRGRALRGAVVLVSAASLVPLVLMTREQTRTWIDSTSVFAHALAVTRDNDVAHINLGLALLGAGRNNEAIEHFREALRIKPVSTAARINLGIALHTAGRDAEAVEQFRLVIAAGLNSAEVQVNYGTALAGMGRIDDAIERFGEALRLDPDSAEAHRNLGNVLSRTGKPAEAMAHFDRLVQLRPDDATARFGRATALAGAARFDAAVQELETGLRLKPDSPMALNFLGNLLARESRMKEAIARYQEAVRLKPDFVQARNNLGIALAQENRLPEAIEQFEAALRFQPDFEPARDNLRRAQSR